MIYLSPKTCSLYQSFKFENIIQEYNQNVEENAYRVQHLFTSETGKKMGVTKIPINGKISKEYELEWNILR